MQKSQQSQKSKKSQKSRYSKSSTSLPRSIYTESKRLGTAWMKHAVIGFPVKLGKSVLNDPKFEGVSNLNRLRDLAGQSILDLFNDLGPVYGKVGQMYLSRLSESGQSIAESYQLTRLYGDWPPLDFDEIQQILDDEIPQWRGQLTVSPHPLGVASMAQVHSCVDEEGNDWIIKILKPYASVRLTETITLIEQVVGLFEPIAATHASKMIVRDLKDLCFGFRQEISLNQERKTIEKVHEKMKGRRQKLLAIPRICREYSTDKVLTMERFHGTPLSQIVNGKVKLPLAAKKKMAKTLLHELLIQVFEMGLFHGDPHAGNLMLLEDMSIGLFDWGLAGELKESDRKHVASILKAVIVMDVDRLIEALYDLATETPGKKITRAAIRKEVKKLAIRIKPKTETDPKPSLCDLIEACLKSASRLGIVMPQGLLLMAKSLVTIEGLAKGIDPEVPLKRIASPVLFRAAKPGIQDFVMLTKNLPKIARRFMA